MADQQFDYDLITLGAGSGGVRASRFSAQLYGAKVAVVELPFGFISSDDIGGAGGTCVIRGCVPKKLLVYSSQFSDEFSDSKGFGWTHSGGSASHNWKEMMSHKGKEIQRLNGVYNGILKGAGVTYIEGRGFLVDAHTVEVRGVDGSSQRLRAKNILLAVGGYPYKLPVEGADLAITSDEALSLEEPPSGPVVVLGAGYIACEFAGIFRGMGYETHLLFRGDKVLRTFDEECRAQVQENLGKRGVQLHADATPVRITRGGAHGLVVHYATKGDAASASGAELREVQCGLVMAATGRKPRTHALGLDAAGVEVDADGAIKVDDFSRTNVPSIWAIGDATNRVNLTPVALMEGMAFAKSCFAGVMTKPDYDFVPSAVFSQPPLASVGFSEEDAVKNFSGEIDVYVSKFRPMKYTLSGRDEKTLMKLIVHKETDRVIGCHMVGPDAPEIMQGIAVALKAGATKAVFDGTIGIHPSAAEEFVTMRSKTRSVQGLGSAKL